MKLTEEFKSIPSQNVKYINNHDKNKPTEYYFFLVKQLYNQIKDRKRALRNERIILEN